MAKIFIFILCSGLHSIFGQLRLDYYYDQSGMFTKFSDWIPKRLHQYHPQHLEDFFLLYSLKQTYRQEELRRNIFFLKLALTKNFRHPQAALIPIKTAEEYHKYRLLLFMHINLKIMRSYLSLGALFDKRYVYFYNLDFSKELKESFTVAEGFYKEAIPYWIKALEYAKEASKYPFEIDLDTLESIRHEIITKEMDFDVYIKNHLERLQTKQAVVDKHLSNRKNN